MAHDKICVRVWERYLLRYSFAHLSTNPDLAPCDVDESGRRLHEAQLLVVVVVVSDNGGREMVRGHSQTIEKLLPQP